MKIYFQREPSLENICFFDSKEQKSLPYIFTSVCIYLYVFDRILQCIRKGRKMASFSILLSNQITKVSCQKSKWIIEKFSTKPFDDPAFQIEISDNKDLGIKLHQLPRKIFLRIRLKKKKKKKKKKRWSNKRKFTIKNLFLSSKKLKEVSLIFSDRRFICSRLIL